MSVTLLHSATFRFTLHGIRLLPAALNCGLACFALDLLHPPRVEHHQTFGGWRVCVSLWSRSYGCNNQLICNHTLFFHLLLVMRQQYACPRQISLRMNKKNLESDFIATKLFIVICNCCRDWSGMVNCTTLPCECIPRMMIVWTHPLSPLVLLLGLLHPLLPLLQLPLLTLALVLPPVLCDFVCLLREMNWLQTQSLAIITSTLDVHINCQLWCHHFLGR